MMRELLKIIGLLVLMFVAVILSRRCNEETPRGNVGLQESDTVIVYDTVKVLEPAIVGERSTGFKRYAVARRCIKYDDNKGVGVMAEEVIDDTDSEEEQRGGSDSVVIEIPTLQRYYSDSTYEAWVSGAIDPRLDSIRVCLKTRYITERVIEPKKRWYIGVSAGYGYGANGFHPYIGIGITYSLIRF